MQYLINYPAVLLVSIVQVWLLPTGHSQHSSIHLFSHHRLDIIIVLPLGQNFTALALTERVLQSNFVNDMRLLNEVINMFAFFDKAAMNGAVVAFDVFQSFDVGDVLIFVELDIALFSSMHHSYYCRTTLIILINTHHYYHTPIIVLTNLSYFIFSHYTTNDMSYQSFLLL